MVTTKWNTGSNILKTTGMFNLAVWLVFLYLDNGDSVILLTQEARDRDSTSGAKGWKWKTKKPRWASQKKIEKNKRRHRTKKNYYEKGIWDITVRIQRLIISEWRGKRVLDDTERVRAWGRSSKKDGGRRVLQTQCSQAHTGSLCTDLLSVWILFRSNTGRCKKILFDFPLWAIYDIAGVLK